MHMDTWTHVFCTWHMFCTWTPSAHGHTGRILHTWTHILHTDVCFAQLSKAAATAELDADDRDAALAPSPARHASTTGELQFPALADTSAGGPCLQHRESSGYGAGGAWPQAAWSPRLRTAASWAMWVRAGRRGGCGRGAREQGLWSRGAGKRARTAGARSQGLRGCI